MAKWHDNIPKELLKEWDRKLKDDGFYDIEAGVGRDGHLLKGPTPSFSLLAATGQNLRDFDDVAGSDEPLYNFSDGQKAEYYRLAERSCVRLAHEITPDRLYCWCLHSQGVGERDISSFIELRREKVRAHIHALRDEIRRLTSTPEYVNIEV
jgi:hypothetical protein